MHPIQEKSVQDGITAIIFDDEKNPKKVLLSLEEKIEIIIAHNRIIKNYAVRTIIFDLSKVTFIRVDDFNSIQKCFSKLKDNGIQLKIVLHPEKIVFEKSNALMLKKIYATFKSINEALAD